MFGPRRPREMNPMYVGAFRLSVMSAKKIWRNKTKRKKKQVKFVYVQKPRETNPKCILVL